MHNVLNEKRFYVKRLFLILTTLLCADFSLAQKLVPDVHDLGRVKLYNNPTLIFTFTNTSSKPVMFMATPYMRDLEIITPEGYIQPGESVRIKVRYFTEEYGTIRVHQPIYINTRNDPFYINITGRIVSFHPNALTMCPSMNKTEADVRQEQSSNPTVTTYDKRTGMTIKGASLLFSGPTKQFLIENSKNPMVTLEGIPIGLYRVEVSMKGYKPLEETLYISRGGGHFILALEPLDTMLHEPAITQVTEPEPGEEELFEVEEVLVEEEINEPPVTEDTEEEVFVLEPQEEEQEEGIDRIRRMVREQYKDREIIEKDVVVIDTDSVEAEVVAENTPGEPVSETDTAVAIPAEQMLPDFEQDGSLSAKYRRNNIVFLIDVSSSMKSPDKLPLLKEAMKNMVSVLRASDYVTIITYASTTQVVLPPLSGDRKDEIYAVTDSLSAFGYSKGADGMGMAYKEAINNFIPGGNNQIILATDGLFNSTDITEDDLYNMALLHLTQYEIRLSVVAFGKSNSALSFMKGLSDHGRGSFIRIDPASEANRELVMEIMRNALKG